MKKLLVCLLIVVSLAVVSYAEPFLTDDLNLIGKNNLELGLSFSYGIDKWDWADNTAGSSIFGLTNLVFPIKYGISDKLDAQIEVPYRSWKSEIEFAGAKTETNESGIGQIAAGVKYLFCNNLGAVVKIQTPTGDTEKMLGEGTDAGIFLVPSLKVAGLNLSANLGYIYKSKFKSIGIEYDPADPIVARISAEYPYGNLSLIAEGQTQIFGKVKVAGASVDGTNGSTVDTVFGAQLVKDSLKFKLGFGLGLGKEDFKAGSPLFHFYDSWDWRIIFGSSYKFKI